MPNNGNVRRLTREQYRHTLQELLMLDMLLAKLARSVRHGYAGSEARQELRTAHNQAEHLDDDLTQFVAKLQ